MSRELQGFPVEKLIEELKKLPPNSVVFPNRVQNLSVLLDGKWIGYIEFGIDQEFVPRDKNQ